VSGTTNESGIDLFSAFFALFPLQPENDIMATIKIIVEKNTFMAS
jgi:hypothetical protein